MIKKIFFISIIFLLLLQTAYALPSRIQILNLEYEENKLSLTNKITKLGYYPDRKIQPESGFRCEIVSSDNEVLYTFKFKIPNKIFVDVTDPVKNELSGGIVKLDKTEFALIVPYFKEAAEINFYDEKGKKALTIDIAEERLSIRRDMWLIIFGLLFLLIVSYLIHKNKKR